MVSFVWPNLKFFSLHGENHVYKIHSFTYSNFACVGLPNFDFVRNVQICSSFPLEHFKTLAASSLDLQCRSAFFEMNCGEAGINHVHCCMQKFLTD